MSRCERKLLTLSLRSLTVSEGLTLRVMQPPEASLSSTNTLMLQNSGQCKYYTVKLRAMIPLVTPLNNSIDRINKQEILLIFHNQFHQFVDFKIFIVLIKDTKIQ